MLCVFAPAPRPDAVPLQRLSSRPLLRRCDIVGKAGDRDRWQLESRACSNILLRWYAPSGSRQAWRWRLSGAAPERRFGRTSQLALRSLRPRPVSRLLRHSTGFRQGFFLRGCSSFSSSPVVHSRVARGRGRPAHPPREMRLSSVLRALLVAVQAHEQLLRNCRRAVGGPFGRLARA